MKIEVDRRESVTVVRLAGSLDGSTAPELEHAVQKETAAGATRLVLVFTDVDYTSSAGLRVLLGATKDARARGGDVRLAAVREHVRKVLELSGFTGILKLYPDEAAATASFA
jgi:anti-anti-sigma factor